MFDVAPSELMLVAVVALLVIGPKDLPLALRAVGRWVGKMRRMSGHFRAGIDTMIREAELAEIEKEWRERNERIMAEHPDGDAVSPFGRAAPAPAFDDPSMTALEHPAPDDAGEFAQPASPPASPSPLAPARGAAASGDEPAQPQPAAIDPDEGKAG